MAQLPEGVGHVASRHGWSYRFRASSSSPEAALDWLLAPARLSELAFREECSWTPKGLIFVAILWAWSDEKSLTQRFFHARKVVMAMGILARIPATTYQAFLKMLTTWTVVLATDALRRLSPTHAIGPRRTVRGLRIPGLRRRRQPSRIAPHRIQRGAVFARQDARPTANAKAKSRRKPSPTARSQASRARRAREKKANSPQMWLTTMFHVGTGLPWDWRTGPSDSSERDHLRQMIEALPAGALVTADAGFVGYETWKAILDSGRHLLIRVGANVRLLRKLGYVKESDGPGLPLAGSRGRAKSTAAGVADGRGPRRATSGLSGHVGARRNGPLGRAGGGDLCSSLGNRTVLSPLQADLRAPQVAEPSRGERRVGGDLVACWGCGR